MSPRIKWPLGSPINVVFSFADDLDIIAKTHDDGKNVQPYKGIVDDARGSMEDRSLLPPRISIGGASFKVVNVLMYLVSLVTADNERGLKNNDRELHQL